VLAKNPPEGTFRLSIPLGDKRLQGAPWYTVDGKSYGVPYQ